MTAQKSARRSKADPQVLKANEAKWGKPLMEAGFTVFPNIILEGSVANLTKGRGAPGRKTCSTYVSALARRSCSNVIASVRTHGPTPKARSTILASPTRPPWMANIRAWPLRSARITSKPLIVA